MSKCEIRSYIKKLPISETEQERLNLIHESIGNKAIKSKAFRKFEGKLYTKKFTYNKAIDFIANVNQEYNSPIAKIVQTSPSQHILSVNVLPLSNELQGSLFNSEDTPQLVQDKLRDKFFGENNTISSVEILNKIANSDHNLNKLAKHLIKYAEQNNVQIELAPVDKFSEIAPNLKNPVAYYSVKDNKIYLSEFGKYRQQGSENAIIHEILHSLSHNILRNTEVSNDLNQLFEYAKSSLEQEYPLSNIDEFFVALFTDAGFIKRLQNLKPLNTVKEYKNLFEEIFDYILGVLGITKGSNLYEQAFSIGTHVLEEERLLNEGLNQVPQEELNNIKPGVQFVFQQNPELSNIGTEEEYSEYLSTIFPNSNNNSLFYHGSLRNNSRIDTFRGVSKGLGMGNKEDNNLYFTKDRKIADRYVKSVLDSENDYNTSEHIKTVILNSPKTIIVQGETDYFISDINDIHILGSKQDIEGFREYIQGNNINLFNKEETDKSYIINEVIRVTNSKSLQELSGKLLIAIQSRIEDSEEQKQFSANAWNSIYPIIIKIRDNEDLNQSDIEILEKALKIYKLRNGIKDDDFKVLFNEEETEINLGDLVTEIPEDITEEGEILHSENENRLTNLQVQRLRNIQTELSQTKKGDNLERQKLNTRIKIVENSIKKLQEQIGYNSLIFTQNRSILDAINVLDDQNSNDFKYVQNVLDDSATLANLIEQVHSELNDNQKARLSDLRVNLGKLQVKYNLVSTKVANSYAGDVGIEYTNPEVAKRDIGMFGKLFLSLAEAKNIPEAQIISRWLNYTKNKVNEKVQNLKDKINAIRINNPDWEEKLKTFFDSKGKFITEYLSSYYDEEKKINQEKDKIVRDPNTTNLQKALAFENTRDWYIKNSTYQRSTFGDARYEQELKDFYALNEDTRLNNPAQFDAELFIFEQENSPQAYLDYIRDVKIDPKHYHPGVHKRIGYRHLLVQPNSSFENPAFRNIENDEVYQLIRDIIIETQSLIPRKTTFDTGNFDKVLNEFTLDMSQDPFTMKGLLNGLGRSFSEYFTPAKDNAEVNFHAVDSKGNDISFILSPDIEKFKKSSPEDLFDVLTKFYEMGVVYDNNTKLLPILQLYSDKLAERPVIKLNKFGNPVYSPKRDPSTGKALRDPITGKVIRNESPDVITGGNSNIRDLVLFTIRSQIFGETKSDEDSTLAFWGDKLINYTRLLGIGLKPFSAVNNYIIGKLNNYAWAANGKDFNDSDLTKAQGVIYGNIMRAFNIEKSITPEAKKLALLLKKFNILGENISKFEGDAQNKFTDIMYFLMTSGEYLIHSEGFIAKMFNTKITKLDGITEGNLWDYFQLGEGDNITYNTKEYGDLKTWKEINPNSDINNWLYQYNEYRKATQGDYANPLYANQSVYLRAVTIFRRWLPQAAYQRFGRETDDKSFKGRFLSIGEINTIFKEKKKTSDNVIDKVIPPLIKTLARMVGEATYISAGIRKFKGENFEENYRKLGLETIDIKNMQVNIRELRLAAWSLAIILALGAAGDGDDKDLALASNLASRVYMDLTFWGNPNSAFGIIKSPIPLISTINRFIDVQNAGYNYLFHHSVDTYQRGVYEGYSKLGIAGINATPGAAAITNTIGVVSQKFSSDSYRHQK
jgi:hypothetical protein